MSTTTLHWIAECARQRGAEVKVAADGLAISLEVPLADGRKPHYQLLITADGAMPRARENPSCDARLPVFCPERHINSDSSFCLFWTEHENIQVTDADSANDWFDILIKFLMIQERASKSRLWPGEAWAHGMAALHQRAAIHAAGSIDPGFVVDVKERRFESIRRPAKSNRHGPLLIVKRNGKELYRVWINERRVIKLRQPCLCKSERRRPKRLRACGVHARSVADLGISLWQWKDAEDKYWSDYSERICCGTMNNCPLMAINQASPIDDRDVIKPMLDSRQRPCGRAEP